MPALPGGPRSRFARDPDLNLVRIHVCIWRGSGRLGQFLGEPGAPSVLSALPAGFVIAGVATVPQALLRRRPRFRELGGADLLSQALGYGLVTIAMALLGFGVRAGSHWGLAGAATPVTAGR